MRLSVTTPRGALVHTEVDELSAPGVLGEFWVMHGHVPFLSALKPGVFTYRQKSDSHVLAVSDGILEVVRTEAGDKVLVLVADAVDAEEIDRAEATQQMATADAELNKWSKDLGGEYKALLTRRAWAAARADAAGRVTPH